MKKLRLLSLVGITSIALAHAGWAADHSGGGGGFGGGGFSGGGRRSGGGARGGFASAPHFGGGLGGSPAPGPSTVVGVGTRGGGVGFGMGRYTPYQSAPSSSIRSTTAGRSVNPVVSAARGNRTGNASDQARTALNRPDNRGGSVSDRRGQTSRATTPRPSNEAVFNRDHHIFARENGAQHRDWDRRHAHFFSGHWFCWDGAFWIGLDYGYYPWDFYPYYGYDYYPYDYYTDVEPSYQNYGNQQSDPTVSTVQTDLTQLGYYNGPIDGLFGADTRTALTRYQVDHHLQVSGSLTNETLQSLGLPGLASN